MLFKIMLASLSTRKLIASLMIIAIALSLMLMLAVDRLRYQVKNNFTSTVSGIDLIVGARGSSINLLLNSVFRISDTTAGIRWHTVEHLAQHPDVKWWIPIALGDYHRGFPVVATNDSYLAHYRYGQSHALKVAHGNWFEQTDQAVLGSVVAQQFGYQPGDAIVLSHGSGGPSIISHDDHPFTITGILAATGTPVDHSVHIPLEGMSVIHKDSRFLSGAPPTANRQANLPDTVNAVMLGLERRTAILSLQRELARYSREPLTAIIPGVELQRLWRMTGQVENVLRVVGALVLVVSLLVLISTMLAALEGRRHELAVLRAAGAGRFAIYRIVAGESLALTFVGCLAGLVMLFVIQWLAAPQVLMQWSFQLPQYFIAFQELPLIITVLLAGTLSGLIPAERAFRNSLADGLTPRN